MKQLVPLFPSGVFHGYLGEAADGPQLDTKWTRSYLHDNGSITPDAPASDEPTLSFAYDPFLCPGQEARDCAT